MTKLPPMQQKFVDAYDGHGERAAISAGYSKKTARSKASQLLTKVNIINAIKERENKPKALRIWNREERQNFWTRIAMGEEPDTDMKDRLKATELLGRSEADFTEKIQADMNVKVVRKEYKKSK